jgi:uncharacterized protein YigE (DUF2233 family)
MTIKISSWLRQSVHLLPRVWRLSLWFLWAMSGCGSAAQSSVRSLAPGLEYLDLQIDGEARAHVFRIDLAQWRPFSVLAKSAARDLAPVETLATETRATLMLNGGFFDQELKPMGLIISEGKQLVALRKDSDWGVFFVRGGTPFLKHTREISDTKDFSFAVQCGPRILIDQKVPKLKPQSYARTAIGVSRDLKLLLLVTYQASVAADVLGAFFQEKLQATDAMLLDGGPSTQLYAELPGFSLRRPGGTGVAHGIGLVRQSNAP